MKTLMLLSMLVAAGWSIPLRPSYAQDWDPTKIELTQTALENAAQHAKAIGCKTQECSSLIRLQFLDQYVEQYITSGDNGRFDLIINDRYGIARRRLDFHLLQHHEVYQPFCAYMVKLFQKIRSEHVAIELSVPIEMFLYAVDMDTKDHGHCTQDLSEALGDTPFNENIRERSEDICKNDFLVSKRPVTICRKIRAAKKSSPYQ